MTRTISAGVGACLTLLMVSPIAEGGTFRHKTPPDLTKGGKPDDTRDWRLGPIGANGWVFCRTTREGASLESRQILITLVDRDGPAAGKLEADDVILGADGRKFTADARRSLAEAIDEAEKVANRGALRLIVWRKGAEREVTLTLPVMGSYSATMPFNCPKTDKIIDNAVAYIKENKDTLLEYKKIDTINTYNVGWINYITGLGLMATGREDVMPMVRELAHKTILKPGETLSVEKHVSMMCWHWAYRTLFLCEYYLRTKDRAVLPTIEELATKIAMGQSGAGTWGHTYAARQNTGYLHGHLGGYGAINQIGLTNMILLPLAKKCGVDNKEVLDAIKRGNDFFSYFIGKGTIPYGDHGANGEWFDDNGKSGQAAIFFDFMGNRTGSQFFAEMILGSAPNGREEGHTGCFWSHLWGGVGVARAGDRALKAFFKEMSWAFTLERQPNGRMAFQDNAGEEGKKGDPKAKWDSTGARLLQLCIPRRNLYITGKDTPSSTRLSQTRIDEVMAAGRLMGDVAARAGLRERRIYGLLEDPLPPVRAIGAKALAERGIDCVDKLIEMLGSGNRYARYGAAEALCNAGLGSKEAAGKLIRMMAEDDDVLFKMYAMAALTNRDTKRGLLAAAEPAIPVLLRMAVVHTPDDPRHVLQLAICVALFGNRGWEPKIGLVAHYGLEGVDRSLLIPAVREILRNENGYARSVLSKWLYPRLTAAEVEQMWGDIHRASRHIAPSGIMFASEVRTDGLKLMARQHVKEGLDLAVWYVRHQKDHGKEKRVPAALEAILAYGAHARRCVPELEKHAAWFESQRGGADSAKRIREAVKEIEAMPAPDFELISIAEYLFDQGSQRK